MLDLSGVGVAAIGMNNAVNGLEMRERLQQEGEEGEDKVPREGRRNQQLSKIIQVFTLA